MITVKNLHKHFKVFKHHRGALGALRNLFTREYAWVNAVDGISFDIGAGELVGYIGPNGAGKSTTIKMLSGLLVPSSGELRVMDQCALEIPPCVCRPYRRSLWTADDLVVGPAGHRIPGFAAVYLPDSI